MSLPTPKYLMASLGDSMTAASLADTQLTSPHLPVTPQDVQEKVLYENKATFSWASGEKTSSHFMRLKDYMIQHHQPGTLEMFNIAVPGNTTINLEQQAKSVAEQFKTGKYASLKYVTILMGNNDACSSASPVGTPDAAFYDNFMKGLTRLSEIQQTERIRVLVSGIPRIVDLGRPAIQNTEVFPGMSCHKLRDQILKFCNPLTAWVTEAEYRARLAVVTSRNELIERIVHDASLRYPNLDFHFTDAPFNLSLEPSVLAIDCFHPNESGQAMLASVLWNDQPWFK